MRISKFMTPDPVTVDEELSLADALERMSLAGVRHLVVTRNEQAVGILSHRDIGVAAALPSVDLDKTALRFAARQEPYTCAPDALVADVAKEMEHHRFGCVVVMDGRKVVGMFTTTDALRVLRHVLTGKPAERLSPPAHLREKDQSHARIRVRTSDRM